MKLARAFWILALASCGGTEEPPIKPHGIPRSDLMQDLTDEQRTSYCEWSTEARGGEGYVEECDGYTFTVESISDCRANTLGYGTCGLSVGQVDDCTDDVAEDRCGFSQAEGTACGVLAQCP